MSGNPQFWQDFCLEVQNIFQLIDAIMLFFNDFELKTFFVVRTRARLILFTLDIKSGGGVE